MGRARHLLQGILPPELASELGLESLSPEPTSHVSEALRESITDLLFSCPLRNRRALVAILLEHKTWEPAYPHLQILRYMVGIWERNLSDKVPLQVVIPVVVHQASTVWKSIRFIDSFPDLPKFRCLWRTWPATGMVSKNSPILRYRQLWR